MRGTLIAISPSSRGYPRGSLGLPAAFRRRIPGGPPAAPGGAFRLCPEIPQCGGKVAPARGPPDPREALSALFWRPIRPEPATTRPAGPSAALSPPASRCYAALSFGRIAMRPVWFISDAHLGSSADPADDEARLARLLPVPAPTWPSGAAEHLYILGDLFDFWFEYVHMMPRRHLQDSDRDPGSVLLGRPRHLPRAGTTTGGPEKRSRSGPGCGSRRNPFPVEHQGRLRFYLAHGDGLASKHDSGYLLLKALIRNPAGDRASSGSSIPTWPTRLGFRLSKFSRTHLTSRRRSSEIAPQPRRGDRCAALAEGHDAFLMGHLHARHRERSARAAASCSYLATG